MIHGTAVVLYNRTQTGTDGFNHPIYSWEVVDTVQDVLVGEPTPQERADELNLTGKRIAYSLGIPKGDTHIWKDQIVEIFGERFRVFGFPKRGIEANIPLRWHEIWKVERYE